MFCEKMKKTNNAFDGYVIDREFNTKDWFVYEDTTDTYLNYFDTKEEAIDWLKEYLKKKKEVN